MTRPATAARRDCAAVPPRERAGVVPVHPERTDDPGTLRWHAGLWVYDDAAGALRELVDAGLLGGYTATGGITTTLATGVNWPEAGPRVRAAVRATLEAVRIGRGLDAAGRDEVLGHAADAVIADLVGPAAAGHGGSVHLVSVRDGVVTVRMAGACHGCPAATVTLQAGLANALRARVPWLREVRADH